MHPILLRLGHVAIPTQGVLAAIGLLLGLEVAGTLGKWLDLSPERLWNLGFVTLATYFCGERLLVIVANLRDFITHPLWMLGLTTIRDERYTGAALLLSLCAGAAYMLAWRLPVRRVLDAAAPGAALAMACLRFGALAAGADSGRPSSSLGIVYTSRAAARINGTPLGVPLVPITLYAAVCQVLLAMLCARLALSARAPGTAAAAWLGVAGLVTIVLDQLRYPNPSESLVLSVFTPAQCLGIGAVAAACVLWLSRIPSVASVPLREESSASIASACDLES